MSVAGPGLNILIENLSQLGLHNSHLIADVREDIDNLRRELEYLQSVMGNLSRYDYESSYSNVTSKEIRGMVDEAEDVVDTYIVTAGIQKSKSWMSRAVNSKELRDAGKRIEHMTDKVKKINERNMRARIDAPISLAIPRVNKPGVSSEAPIVEEDHVVGFEKPAQVMSELVKEGPKNLEVIAIAGMSGLGKTTLAKLVYKDPNVEYMFMIRAFVCVSRQFDKKDVLLRILDSFTRSSDEVKERKEMNAEQLEYHVCRELEGKQYLIVLDDVWELEDWDALKGAFPNNGKRCRVLMTTTNARLAEYANPLNPDSLYMLDFLTLEKSTELLQWRVFRGDNCPDEIQKYMLDIAKKCDGLPLALVLIAGVLWDRRDRVTWWKEVSGSVYKYLSKDAQDGNKLVDMMYEHLPNKLKPCFLYLGVFHKDTEIPVWKLVRLWISEGFIDRGDNSDLEDTAEQYLEELVQRNLVMVGKRRSNGKLQTCRLHDALREFCKKEGEEENLFQEINRHNFNLRLDNCRRLYINGPITEDYISTSRPGSGKRVRSFLTFREEESTVDVSFIPKTFKLLKVLETDSLHLSRLPLDLGHLVLLKYLTINSNISTIPSALSGLWFLQTLIVRTTSTLEVNMDLWKLPHFRHFHTNTAAHLPTPDTKGQKSEAQLVETSIRTLCTISTECCSRKVLDRTPKLKKLGIYGDLCKLFGDGESVVKLCQLENLKLINPESNDQLYSLPHHAWFPPQLTKLTLMNTLLEWKEMSTLGKLENLEVLKLKEYAFKGKSWDTEKGGFPHLVHLYIGTSDLNLWSEASMEHFPKLETLKLNCCDKLETLPLGLLDIPSLQLLVLHCTNPTVASSARILQKSRGGDKKNNLKLSIYPPDH